MRVLYVTASFPYGPGETYLLPEIEELARCGNEVGVVPMLPRGAMAQHSSAHCLSGAKLLNAEIAAGALAALVTSPIRSFKAIRPLFRSRNGRVFLKNLSMFPKGLWLARKAREWRAEHIHAYWAANSATLAMIASEVSGIPWSFTAHRWDIIENNLLADKGERAAFVRFISRSGMRMAWELGIQWLDEKARVLHLGVRLPQRNAAKSRPENARPVLLCPGFLYPVKGHRFLLEACAILRERGTDVDLHLAGEGWLREELENLVRSLDIGDRVKFLGQLPHDDLMRLYRERQVDLVVLPSVDLGNGEHEGLPVSLIEAMSYGIPVVSTNTGGIPELLQDGAGEVVAAADPLALVRAIEKLVKDPTYKSQLAEAGRRRIESDYAIEERVTELARLFAAEAEESLQHEYSPMATERRAA